MDQHVDPAELPLGDVEERPHGVLIGDIDLDGDGAPTRGARTQAEKYEATDGAEDNTIIGLPVVVVTSIGAKTGKLRKTPLMRAEHEGEYLAVGSLGGAEKNPVWVYNVRANPLVELQDGSAKHDYQARELDGDERELWWARAVEAFPNYAGYQRKTSRTIPVFLLTRA